MLFSLFFKGDLLTDAVNTIGYVRTHHIKSKFLVLWVKILNIPISCKTRSPPKAWCVYDVQ